MCVSAMMSAACCAVSSLCNCLCCCCQSMCDCSLRQQVKIVYLVIFALCNVFTLLVLYQLQSLLNNYASFLNCPQVDGQNICVGVSSVLRMALVLCIFHFMLMLAMLFRGKTARSINEGAFLFKILLIIGGFVGCMFISNTVFMGAFYDLCRAASVIFLCFQALMMTDLFYLWGERWVAKFDDGMNSCKVWLPMTTLIIYGIWVTLLVLMGHYFSGDIPMGMLAGQVVGGVILFIMLVAGVRQNGSLLTTAAVTMFSGYWLWSGLVSNNNREQNSLLNKTENVMVAGLVVDGIMAIVTLLYLTFGMSSQDQHVGVANQLLINDEEGRKDVEMADRDKEQQQQPAAQPNEEQLAVQAYESNNYVYFHLVMSVLSLYIVMVLTNWGAPVIDNKTIANLKPNQTAMYTKAATSYFTLLLYAWTMVAPRILTHRQF